MNNFFIFKYCLIDKYYQFSKTVLAAKLQLFTYCYKGFATFNTIAAGL